MPHAVLAVGCTVAPCCKLISKDEIKKLIQDIKIEKDDVKRKDMLQKLEQGTIPCFDFDALNDSEFKDLIDDLTDERSFSGPSFSDRSAEYMFPNLGKRKAWALPALDRDYRLGLEGKTGLLQVMGSQVSVGKVLDLQEIEETRQSLKRFETSLSPDKDYKTTLIEYEMKGGFEFAIAEAVERNRNNVQFIDYLDSILESDEYWTFTTIARQLPEMMPQSKRSLPALKRALKIQLAKEKKEELSDPPRDEQSMTRFMFTMRESDTIEFSISEIEGKVMLSPQNGPKWNEIRNPLLTNIAK